MKLSEISPKTHRQVFECLRKNGIGVNLHYIPIHTQPFYQKLGFNWGDFPNSESYYNEAISIPIFPGLKKSEQAEIISKLVEIVS